MTYEKNDYVEWEWGRGKALGQIEKVYTEKTTRTINGNEVTREASNSNPAYYILQLDGDSRVLKSHSEVSKLTKETAYETAKDQDVHGRSEMTKSELLESVSE